MTEHRPEAELHQFLWHLLLGVGEEHSPYEPGRIRTLDDVRSTIAQYYGAQIADRVRIVIH
jgi:hypothetical protein